MLEKVRTEELSRKQETFIAALLTLPTFGAAAKAAGVSDKTAHQWIKQPHISQAYKDARKAAFEAALDTLQDFVAESIRTLRLVHLDKEAPHSVRVRAAQILLENAISIHKFSELEERLAVLEEKGREQRAHPTD